MNIKTFAFLVACGFMLTACNDESMQSSQTEPQEVQGRVATLTNWPSSDANVTQADNLFTSNLVIVLDMSGSMGEYACKGNGTKYDVSLAAIRQFLTDVPDDMSLGLVVFENNRSSVRVPLGPNQHVAIDQHLRQVRPDGGTPLGQAVGVAYDQLLIAAESQLGFGQYRMLIVTDGAASDEGKLAQNVAWLTSSTPVEVFTAGFCIGEGHTLNQPDRTVFREAGNVTELVMAMKEVLAESTSLDVDSFK